MFSRQVGGGVHHRQGKLLCSKAVLPFRSATPMACGGPSLSCRGRALFLTLFLGILLIILGSIVTALGEPSGLLPLFYSVETCLSITDSFSISTRGFFDAYVARPLYSSDLPGSACPAYIPANADPITITLEESDGFRPSATYYPVMVLPGGTTYAIATLSVVDEAGATLLPSDTYSLGVNQEFPWTASSASITMATSDNFTSAAPVASACFDTCNYASDGMCDDGGPGAEYSLCSLDTDCADCDGASSGRRLEQEAKEAMPSASGPPRRRLLYASDAHRDYWSANRAADVTVLLPGSCHALACNPCPMHARPPACSRATPMVLTTPPRFACMFSGSRRLLKGSSGRGASYSSGSSYSAGSSPSRSSFTSRSTSHGASFAPASYSVGGRTYHTPSSPYAYRHAPGWCAWLANLSSCPSPRTFSHAHVHIHLPPGNAPRRPIT
jgi:hypothetical protein